MSDDIESLNLDALDVRELEQRIEMSVATDPITQGYICGADCDSNCTVHDICGSDDGGCTADGCVTDGGGGGGGCSDPEIRPAYIEPC